MRIAELTGLRQLRLTEGSIADPGPGEVQVQVAAVGICGSDMHAYSEGGVGGMDCAYPMVLGHEPSGVVAKLGAGVGGWSVGDRVALEPAHYCYHCELCRRGRHNLCLKLRFLSQPGDPGFFRDRVNLPAENLLLLPANISLDAGTLLEPLAVALHSLTLGAPAVGESTVVFGAGPIGLLTIAALKRSGVRRLWAVEPLAHRRELATAMGADATVDPAATDAVAAIRAETRGRGADLVFDCATKGRSPAQALEIAATGGRVVYTGIPSEVTVPMDFHLWRRKELAVHQVRRSNHDGEVARDLMAREPAFYAGIITHHRPLADIGKAFALLDRYEDGVGKLLVHLDE